MKLLIFSYPSHYYISQISAKYAIKNLEGINEIVFLWDDLALNQTDDEINYFINSLENIYSCCVIKYSVIPETINEPNGWLRQQYVKLNLHKIFEDDLWLLMDGDVIIRYPLKVNDFVEKNILLTTTEYYPEYFNFIKYALGLSKKNNFSFICPLFLFEKNVLEELEIFCLKRNGKNIIESFREYMISNIKDIPVPPFSEFEIYGTFSTQILNKKFNYKTSNFIELFDTSKFKDQLELGKRNIILKGTDEDLINFDFKNFLKKI